MLAGLRQQNLPRIYDHFTEAGRWYLVMDFIEGQTLHEHLSTSNGYLPIEEVLQIAIQLCTVLDYLHTHQPQIIFRDLKPDNIMLTRDGHVYLIDFGIARFFKPGQMKDTTAFGSQGYAAPEQYGKTQTTPRSDIYSLGVLLHQLLTGNDPATNTPTLFDFPVLKLPNRPTPPRLSTLITRMLEKDPGKRPQTAAEVKRELQQIAAELSTGQMSTVQSGGKATLPPTQPVAPAPPLPPTRLLPRRTRLWAIVAASIALILILAVLVPILENHPAQSSSQLALNSTSTVAASAPTATPSPTVAPTPSPTPVPPTPTPAPKAGDILYQSDQSWSGWSGSKEWTVLNGTLTNDGTGYPGAPTIIAPYEIGVSDYAVEASIQVVHWNTCCYSEYAMVVRASNQNGSWGGYSIGDDLQGPVAEIAADPGNFRSIISTAPFNPGSGIHTYRVEVKGNRIKLFVDGGIKCDIVDNTYLSGNQIGFWSYGVQLSISSFKIIAL